MSKFARDDSWRRDGQNEDDDQVDEDEKNMTSGRRSVHALSKIFGGQDELSSSRTTLPSSTSSYKKSTYSSLNSDSPSSTRTTTLSRDSTTSETTITTIQSLRSSETFSERVKSSSKGSQYSNFSPNRTTRLTETTVMSDKDAEDKLYDSLIPSAIKDGSPIDSHTTLSMTETVIVKSGTDTTDAEDKLLDTLIPSSPRNDYSPTEFRNGIKTTTTTRTSSTAEDELYGTLLPRTITSVSSLSSAVSSSSSNSITQREIVTVESSRGGDSPTLLSPTSSTRRTSSYSSYTDEIPATRTTSYSISSTPSDDYSSDRKNYSYRTESYEYSSLNSSLLNSKSYRSNSKSDDMLADQTYTSSVKSVYAPPERTVLEKDLCTYCRKPFTGEAKMVLDDMKINCHASCFKCEVCNSTLGHMKAGDSMWIYKRMVHCENCFEVTRDKWRR